MPHPIVPSRKQRPSVIGLVILAFVTLLVVLFGGQAALAGDEAAGGLSVSLVQLATGYAEPVDIASTQVTGDNRLFIVERSGYIRILFPDGSKQATPFLDIDARVGSSSGEQGLLGLVFHPNYASNGYFYINYTDNSGDTRVSRFSVTANPGIADPNSELVILPIDQPFTNHNGGDLAFGPDGYLYIPTGDGGSGGDPGNRAQNGNELLGKVLRLDVDGGSPYAIPADNPFVGDPAVLDEIWALGVRNPWRFSFDRLTGDMWIGDVGQGSWEEIDFEPASSSGGMNWGWRCYEGNHPFNTSGCGPIGNYDFPVHEYSLSGTPCAVTGGFVYRGSIYPDMVGHYFFADYCAGTFWSLFPNGGGGWQLTSFGQLAPTQFSTTSFGERTDGEIFVTNTNGGRILHLVSNNPVPTATPTATATNTPTATPTATATATLPPGNNTGFRSPAAQQANNGGDNNGYEGNPTNAFADDANRASDVNSGTTVSSNCGNSGKDRHRYYDYSFPLPAGATINGIEVRLDALADSTAGSPKLCVQLSWNGGSSWTTVKTTGNLGTSEGTHLLGGAADTWGRTWSTTELSNSNFRLRVINVATDNSRDFFLDWAAVKVYYSGGGTATPTATPGSGNTGLIPPQGHRALTQGDGNGFQTSPTNAFADDGNVAVDTNSGTNTNANCADSGKDGHRFRTFAFNLPGGATIINGIEVRLDALVDSTAGAPFMCVELSWDGGVSWTTVPHTTPTLTTAEATYLLGGPADTWGRTWQPAEFGSSQFQLRIINVATNTDRDFSLDYVAVRVYYQ